MGSEYKILIADDHSIIRQGISHILKESYPEIKTLHAGIFSEVLEVLEKECVDLIVLDIAIPEGKGIQMINLAKAICPETKILIFSAYEEELYALRYLKAGANGYLNKLSSDEEFQNAFCSMIENGSYMSQAIKQKMDNAAPDIPINPIDQLSTRELEIARMLIKGNGNLEIANKLELQNSTVSTYKNRIFEKLAITNTVALVSLFQSYDDVF